MPKSCATVWSLIIQFCESKFGEMKTTLQSLKRSGEKFSISLDEWTDLSNIRYLKITLHTATQIFYLGLMRIPAGHCSSEVIFDLTAEKLAEVDLNIESDIVAASSDGASVMVKYGDLMGTCVQLNCINHGLRLSVVDTMYKLQELEASGKN